MTNPNDPAFIDAMGEGFKNGLTKREYFAAVAMQGLLANNRLVVGVAETEAVDFGYWEATKAIQAANALIAKLNKEPKS